MHRMHLLLSVLVGLYSAARWIFACLRELPEEGLPPVVELPFEAFVAWRYVRAIPWVYHVSHLEGVTPSVCQPTPCKRAVKLTDGGERLGMPRAELHVPVQHSISPGFGI